MAIGAPAPFAILTDLSVIGYLIVHPKGTLIWDTGVVLDSDVGTAARGADRAAVIVKVPGKHAGPSLVVDPARLPAVRLRGHGRRSLVHPRANPSAVDARMVVGVRDAPLADRFV